MTKRAFRLARRAVDSLPARPTTLMGTLTVLAVMILAAMLAVSSGLSYRAANERDMAETWQLQTVELLDNTSELRFSTMMVGRGERGFLLTEDESFLDPYFDGVHNITAMLGVLQKAVEGNDEQKERLALIEQQIDHYLNVVAAIIELQRTGGRDEAIRRIRAGETRRSVEQILSAITEFEMVERTNLANRSHRASIAARRSEMFEYAVGVTGFVLLLLAMVAGLALRRSLAREAHIVDELRRIATTDELTGLANRRELLAALDRMIGASLRHERPLSLAILDIDFFKRVNDTYGHAAGDEVIRRVAEMALELMREQDLVGRIGGEEFIIAFPECDQAMAAAACERLRQGLAAVPIILPDGQSVRVTLSFGVTQFNEQDDRIHLIARADEALYQAKQGGRDQVRLAA